MVQVSFSSAFSTLCSPVLLLVFSALSPNLLCSARIVTRTRGPKRNLMHQITFDPTCKIVCKGSYCMPSFVLCQQLRGLHKCCGEVTAAPPAPSEAITPPSNILSTSGVPEDCSQTTFDFCFTYRTHPCCKNLPNVPILPPKPPPPICLNESCIPEEFKLTYPKCSFAGMPKFGDVIPTLKFYCRKINPKHRCCKKRPPFPTFLTNFTSKTGKDQVQSFPSFANWGLNTVANPKPTLNIPPECQKYYKSPPKPGKSKTRNQKRNRKLKNMMRSPAETEDESEPTENLLTKLCGQQPAHRCCNLNTTETPTTPEKDLQARAWILPYRLSDLQNQLSSNQPNVSSREIPDLLGIQCENYNDELDTCRQTPGCRVHCQDRTCRSEKFLKSQCENECSSNCEDVCACKKSGCQYNQVSDSCRPSNGMCLPRHFEDEGSCKRASTFYGSGGEICVNLMAGGNCSVDEIILAVNLGGEELTDSRGIIYEAGSDVVASGHHKTAVLPKVFAVEKQDENLYKTVIYGPTEMKLKEACVSFTVPLCQDGDYELTIRTIENAYSKEGKRLFTVKFGGLEIFPEIDLVRLVKKAYYTADLSVNFEVEEAGTILDVMGFDDVDIEDNQVKLEFCNSRCDVEDMNYIVSAFSIVRFRDEKKLEKEVELGARGFKTETTDVTCQKFHHLMCSCKKEGCEYNSETRFCEAGNQVCDDDIEVVNQCKLKAKSANVETAVGTSCRRNGVLYSEGGVICQNKEDKGKCEIEDTIWAININGGALTDSRGIEYQADAEELYLDPWGIRVARVFNQDYTNDTNKCPVQPNHRYVTNVPEEEIPLYETFIFGATEKRDLERCISFPIPASKLVDGKYELCLKFVEHYYKEVKMRFFNVKFDEIWVLPEFDILGYTMPCGGIDVIIPFEISEEGNRLTVLGGTKTEIDDDNVKLSFCYGECYLDEGYVDPNFIISAFYIAKMTE